MSTNEFSQDQVINRQRYAVVSFIFPAYDAVKSSAIRATEQYVQKYSWDNITSTNNFLVLEHATNPQMMMEYSWFLSLLDRHLKEEKKFIVLGDISSISKHIGSFLDLEERRIDAEQYSETGTMPSPLMKVREVFKNEEAAKHALSSKYQANVDDPDQIESFYVEVGKWIPVSRTTKDPMAEGSTPTRGTDWTAETIMKIREQKSVSRKAEDERKEFINNLMEKNNIAKAQQRKVIEEMQKFME